MKPTRQELAKADLSAASGAPTTGDHAFFP